MAQKPNKESGLWGNSITSVDHLVPRKLPMIADLNVAPAESDYDDIYPLPTSSTSLPLLHILPPDSKCCASHFQVQQVGSRCVNALKTNEEFNQVKGVSNANDTDVMEIEESEQPCQGTAVMREEKVSNLKAGLIHVTRKMPKNAHSHFLLGLMYQRLNQPQKAASAFDKASEVLLGCEEENRRPGFLSLVQLHQAQCIMQAGIGDGSSKELEPEELEDVRLRLKESMLADSRNSGVWSTLGQILIRTGRLRSAISVLSLVLSVCPGNVDALANLGTAYLQSGNLELSAKCFQELAFKDQNHPAALVNYAAMLLCRYGSVISGPGTGANKGASTEQVEAANVAKECLIEATKADSKVGTIWVNLSNAYYVLGDHESARRCLEHAARLEPNIMSTRYAVALLRIKNIERSQDPSDQGLTWAVDEMTSILKEGEPTVIDLPIAWAGLAMAHQAHHEISMGFETEEAALEETRDRALSSLKQAIEVDPDDAVQWHQLGLHSLCTLQLKDSQKFLKAAVSRCKDCSYTWTNLGTSLQLSGEAASAEKAYRRALSLAVARHVPGILSNLGNLYRQQGQLEAARSTLEKSTELCPGYAPALNNLGLVHVAEAHWEDAIACFKQALLADPLLDAALSNMLKAMALSNSCSPSNKR
ncbi:tetratricopeptide repeat (TPR)-containing protein isoform X2 [Wolffia australiana]